MLCLQQNSNPSILHLLCFILIIIGPNLVLSAHNLTCIQEWFTVIMVSHLLIFTTLLFFFCFFNVQDNSKTLMIFLNFKIYFRIPNQDKTCVAPTNYYQMRLNVQQQQQQNK